MVAVAADEAVAFLLEGSCRYNAQQLRAHRLDALDSLGSSSMPNSIATHQRAKRAHAELSKRVSFALLLVLFGASIGCGSNCTPESKTLTVPASDAGADATCRSLCEPAASLPGLSGCAHDASVVVCSWSYQACGG